MLLGVRGVLAQPHHERRAAHRAHRTAAETVLIKPAFLRQLVEIRRINLLLAVAVQIGSPILQDDQQHIRPARVRGVKRAKRGNQQGNRKAKVCLIPDDPSIAVREIFEVPEESLHRVPKISYRSKYMIIMDEEIIARKWQNRG